MGTDYDGGAGLASDGRTDVMVLCLCLCPRSRWLPAFLVAVMWHMHVEELMGK